MKKKFVLYYDWLRNVHFGKDVFLVPYYLGKQLDCEVSIVYLKCEEVLPTSWRGVHLVPIGGYKWKWLNILCYYFYLCKESKRIDYMMRFHLKWHTFLMVSLYKFLNPKGKAYVKADIDPMDIPEKHEIGVRDKLLIPLFKEKLDVVSCETKWAFKKMKESSSPFFNYGSKLVLMPNGFDEELFSSQKMHVNSFDEKENIMITIGRLGTYQKNTEMLLNALEKVDLKDWKFYLIGSLTEDFKPTWERFVHNHPQKRNKIIYKGEITDKRELFDIYNRAKVFVLTSRFEGYPIVYTEAQRFKNYIISTSVGAAYDVIDDGKYGEMINLSDDSALANSLNRVIQESTNTDVFDSFDMDEISWDKCTGQVLKALKE